MSPAVFCQHSHLPHGSSRPRNHPRLPRAGWHRGLGKWPARGREPRGSAQLLLLLGRAARDGAAPCSAAWAQPCSAAWAQPCAGPGSCRPGTPPLLRAFQMLVYLDLTECGESILQILARNLWSECREMRRQVLRGLVVLSRDPMMVRRGWGPKPCRSE